MAQCICGKRHQQKAEPEVLRLGDCEAGDVIRFREFGPSHRIVSAGQNQRQINLEETRPIAGRLSAGWDGMIVIRGLDS